jgi:hypothetical protein
MTRPSGVIRYEISRRFFDFSPSADESSAAAEAPVSLADGLGAFVELAAVEPAGAEVAAAPASALAGLAEGALAGATSVGGESAE